jgi:hypothetical protein
MKGIISTSKFELETINKQINDYMIETILDYEAMQWGKIVKHLLKEEWILFINDDSRNPLSILTDNNKLKILEVDISNYYKQNLL